MARFVALFRAHRALFMGLGVLMLAVLIWAAWQIGFSRRDPLLDTPRLALAGLQAKALYFNGRARPWLLAERPDLLTPEDRDANSERTRGLVQAVQNWKLFRQLDRRYRFDALLLVGDPSEYKPLLDHLLDRKDWTLRYADHTSLIFRRDEGRPWVLDDFAAVRAQFAGAGANEQAEVLAQTAIRLLAAHEEQAGKTLARLHAYQQARPVTTPPDGRGVHIITGHDAAMLAVLPPCGPG